MTASSSMSSPASTSSSSATGGMSRHDGPAIADPNLFGYYPSDGLGVNRGTFPPENGWDHAAFLLPIVESIGG